MATLSDEVKQFIVQALACFDTPSQVAESVKELFGVIVPRQQCELYDPTRRAGKALSKKWCELFDATRTRWRKETVEIPIANRSTRLRALNRLAERSERKGNYGLALQILEQAAREVGGMYVNRHRSAGGGGGLGDAPVATPIGRGAEYILQPDEAAPANPIL